MQIGKIYYIPLHGILQDKPKIIKIPELQGDRSKFKLGVKKLDFIKKLIIQVADFLVFGNFIMAICGFVWSLVTYKILALPFQWKLPLLIFFGVLLVYNAARINPGKPYKAHGHRENWVVRYQRRIKWLTLIGALGVMYYLWQVPFQIWVTLIIGALVALFYFVPFGKGKDHGLRRIGWIKIFFVAFVWSFATVFPVAIQVKPALSLETAGLFLERFLFIFAITLPFDFRDIRIDLANGIKTFPVLLGENRTKAMILATIIVLSVIYLVHYQALLIPHLLPLLYIFMLTLYLNRGRNEYHYLVFWDGAIIVQGLLVVSWA